MKNPEFHSRALDGALSLMKLVLFKDYGAGVDLAGQRPGPGRFRWGSGGARRQRGGY